MRISYLMRDENNKWFCWLPNHHRKEIPSIDWVISLDWAVVFYKVESSLEQGVLSDSDLANWDLEKILKVGTDIKLY